MHYTLVETIRDSVDLKQFEAPSPEIALREGIAALPYDDGTGPFDEELEWLLHVANGKAEITLHPVDHCKNSWLWLEGARREPQYLIYVIQTDVTSA